MSGPDPMVAAESLEKKIDALPNVAALQADRDELLELVRSLHRVCRASDVRYGGSALEKDVRAALDKNR